MTDVPERTAVYYIRGEAAELLYIGMTNHVAVRWNSHQRIQPWWDELRSLTVDWYDSREAADAAERAAVQAEWPKYNMTYLAPQRRRRAMGVIAQVPQPPEFATPAEPETLMTRGGPVKREELSWYLGISQSTLARWARRAYGPPFDQVADGYWPAEVRAWLDECKGNRSAA